MAGTKIPFSKAKALVLVSLLLISLSLAGCASLSSIFSKTSKESTAEELAQEGMDHLKNGNHFKAQESFQKIKDRYPFSQYGLLADLKLADVHYYKEEYDEAVASYREFEKLHPTNEALPYVVYQVGMCYFKQILGDDRDQSSTTSAQSEFQRLLNTYPDSPYAPDARQKIKECREWLARHEFYIGRFYFRTKRYDAAIKRLTKLAADYPESAIIKETLPLIRDCEDRKREDQSKADPHRAL